MSENGIDKNEIFVNFLLNADLFKLKTCYEADKFNSLRDTVNLDISIQKFKDSINFFWKNYHEIKATYENTSSPKAKDLKKDLFETAIENLKKNDFENLKEKLIEFVANYPEKNESFNDLQCKKIAKFYNALSKISENPNYPTFFNYFQTIIKHEELTSIYFYFMFIVNKNYEHHINNVCKIIEDSITRNTICLLLNLIPINITQSNQYNPNIEIDHNPQI